MDTYDYMYRAMKSEERKERERKKETYVSKGYIYIYF